MSYCSATELQSLTGTDRTDTELQAIIDQADREINLWLKARGVTGSACDELKTVSILLSKVGLQELGQPDGSFEASAGDFYTGNPSRDVAYLRKTAYGLLNDYLATQTTRSTPSFTYVRKVN
jgi:hypothetical protein